MINKIPMTIKGSKKLIKELNQLKNIKRYKIINDIAEARKHGDLKENAEYHAAREEQSFCEKRIKEIELKLSNCQIIDVTKIKNKGKVIFGSTVDIINVITNKVVSYKIVGDDEANLKKYLISINAPISRGLIGKKKNNTVLIKTPKGNITFKILKIQYLE
ncbi:transcription elongation factor GreA [Enterobacteriaceae endosymbiont of Plateumaris consimilis]|uniref:transcription elongation factor GreA n=1 Tax=Enterobacteriaceae endosymbiont of Plateumaris consimilis TaxID=2675794 RepID=UPI00144935A0|nr:transcription elongation factor GreA [Enterobacteriaceae endosymbiont of Plateumaris consimilis]QJC28430.1 transcription elongation factor GreA [Enterobacteriaceae endosymbiont of Plateumaris consimilis]